jgi:hypothetical protein
VSEIRSFLGLAGYYRRFIEGFSKIVKPLTTLLEKDREFKWTSACQSSFEELKKTVDRNTCSSDARSAKEF